MIAFPTAKINLGLHVLEKRLDGFHNIETVLYPIDWFDCLEIQKEKQLSLSVYATDAHGNVRISEDKNLLNSNTCLKAFHLLEDSYDISPVHIHLIKNIPIGAGLGGGSSDGAMTLRILIDLFNLDITSLKLTEFAKQIGSDCSFFLQNKPVLARERGDLLEPVSIDLNAFKILVVYPELLSSTQKAYESIAPDNSRIALSDVITTPLDTWKDRLNNDFENNLFKTHPEIALLKSDLYEAGAIYASMSGSGSALYGIFNQKQTFDLPHFEDRGYQVFES